MCLWDLLTSDFILQGIDFYCWISSIENIDNDSVSSKTISSLLVDMHSHRIALKGSSFFVITFRFLGKVVKIDSALIENKKPHLSVHTQHACWLHTYKSVLLTFNRSLEELSHIPLLPFSFSLQDAQVDIMDIKGVLKCRTVFVMQAKVYKSSKRNWLGIGN